MNKLSLLKKFWLLSGLFTLALLIQLSGSVYTNLMIQNDSRSLASNEIPVLNKAHELKLAVVQVQQWLTDISATRGLDGLNDGFDEAEKNAMVARTLVSELMQLDKRNAEQYQQILPVFENYYNNGIQMAKAYIESGPSGGNKMMAKFDVTAAAITEKVDSLVESTKHNADKLLSNEENDVEKSMWVSFVTSFILVVFVVLMLGTIWGVLKEVPKLSVFIKSIADGNIGINDISTNRKDEIGNLIHDLNQMKGNLVNIIYHVNNSSNNIFSSVDLMRSAVGEMMREMTNEKRLIDNIVDAMNNMSSTASEVSGHAQASANSASDTDVQAKECNQLVKRTIQSIESVSAEIQNGVNVINTMKQESENIGEILSVIRGIADQTNLLALNAAIEAARAGEQGRGFAVVADEVRSLAQRTQDSIEQINNMIESLQAISKQAADVMERSQVTSNTSVEQIKLAGEKLSSIEQSVDVITMMNGQIANAVEEQCAMASTINDTLSEIVIDADHVIEGTDKIVSSSDTIFDMANVLKKDMVAFKI